MSDERILHAGAWLAWLGAVLSITIVTRNPWYLGLLLLWISAVTLIANRRIAADEAEYGASVMPRLSIWRFAAVVIPLAAILNALFVHVGETVILTISPSIPVIGGDVTLEALFYGTLNGVLLTALFAAFLLFNRVTPVRDLIRLAPRAYYPVAVTVAIAITWVPVTLRQAAQIREAQAIRGSQLRGLRGWLPLLLPLLSSGLERAMMLAEAMVARGFASASGAVGWVSQAGLVVGLLLVLAGWLVRLLLDQAWIGAVMVIVGLILLVAGLWQAGRATVRTEYRPAAWGAHEWVVTGCAALTAALFLLPIPGIDRATLYYSPYPLLTVPSFSALFGLATWGLLGPAVVLLREI